MTAAEEDSREPAAAERSRLTIPLFVLAGGLLLAVLALLVPLVPGPFRKLVLFPLGLGMVAGWLLAITAVHAGISAEVRGRGIYLLSTALIFVCLGTAQYRLFLQWQAAAARVNLAGRLDRVASGLAATTGLPAEVRSDFQEAAARVRSESSFGRWLTFRVSRLGEWSEWPALLLLCAECLLGTFAGTFLFIRRFQRG